MFLDFSYTCTWRAQDDLRHFFKQIQKKKIASAILISEIWCHISSQTSHFTMYCTIDLASDAPLWSHLPRAVLNWWLMTWKRVAGLFLKDLQTAHSQKERYKSCHWGGAFSNGTCLYLKGPFWYLKGTYLNLIGTKVYRPSYSFCTFISESAGYNYAYISVI